jgi:hypothetical protein
MRSVVTMPNYPCPCDTCEECINPAGCEKWKIRYLTVWKQIMAYPKRQAKKNQKSRNTFKYEHPDRIRYYLSKSPCEGCIQEKLCDTPCGPYLDWWDDRMSWLKWRFGER